MQPWFYISFKGEKDELLKYKTHWDFIQSRYKDVNGKNFWNVKTNVQNFTQKNKHSITPHDEFGDNLHIFV